MITAAIRTPKRYMRRFLALLNTSRASVHRILRKDMRFHSYKFQIFYELEPKDKFNRIEFCDKFSAKVGGDNQFLSYLWMSGETHFHLNGFVNKLNFRYWFPENSQ